ncbi:MAG TPA: site-2 protease family protein [Pyrinomonadaceae bacterium]|nr:site-2 protease family protein [Pyrinomonadaceae bacterium]
MGNFDPADFLASLIIYMVVWLFAVSAHEAAHAWTSYKFDDDTAYMLGRVTLNPIPHIDVIGTLILPIIGFAVGYFQGASGIPLIMWGKPTPVNPLKWRNKDVANVCVSLAGIFVNLLIATIVSVIIKILIAYGVLTAENIRSGITAPLFSLLYATVILNVGLAVFNLLPLPPLDGSKALQSFLPSSFEPVFDLLETYGFLILIVLAQMGIISFLVMPLRNLILSLLF